MRGLARRWPAVIAAVVALGGAGPERADAGELVTWSLHSKRVDPATAKLGVSAARRDGYPKIPRDALRVNALLPDGYDPTRRYPVLYLLHGDGWGYDFWADPEGGDLLDVAAGLPAVVVMPEGGRGWYTNWWNEGARKNPAWERFHLGRLIRTVHRRLAIRRGRRWHAIAGFSMGGLGAVDYAAARPGYFGSVASLSGILSIQRPESPPAFDGLSASLSGSIDGPGAQPETHQDVWGDPADQEFYWSAHNPVALVENLRATRVLVTSGDGTPYSPDDLLSASYGTPVVALIESTIRSYADEFAEAADAAGVRQLTVNRRAGLHTNFAAGLGLSEAISWRLFRAVPKSPRQWSYETAARSGQAWNLRFRFARPPEELITFTRHGHILAAEGSGDVVMKTPRCKKRSSLPLRLNLGTCRVGIRREAPKSRRTR